MRNAEWEKGKIEMPQETDLKKKTKIFALEIIRLASSLPRSREADILSRQITRSGTSTGANYREACRARSRAEFRSKIGIVEQEADETLFWLELLSESGIGKGELLDKLMVEADELVAIFTAIGKSSKE
jgi:four helix bundle protein